jgi:DNA-binding CsgD family transcriptional regulator
MLTGPDEAVGFGQECGQIREQGRRVTLPEPIAVAHRRVRHLTPRERSVFRLLGLGYDNRAIAHELNISERTVKRYITAILAKLGLRSRLQAGLCALLLFREPPAGAGWPEGLMDPYPVTGNDIGARRPRGSTQEQAMTFDALTALRQGGNPVDILSVEQRDVLAQLTEDEVAVLNSVKRRLDAVGDAEVEGHIGIKVA